VNRAISPLWSFQRVLKAYGTGHGEAGGEHELRVLELIDNTL
jgi:hypothetical protein